MAGFVHTERVRFGDLDAMRHLNNVVFLRYFETARIGYLNSLSESHDPVNRENGFGFIFASCHIDYRSPGHFDEEVAIRVRPAEVGTKSLKLEFDMRVGGGCWLRAMGCWWATTMPRSSPLRCLKR